MRLSDRGAQFIAEFEGFRAEPYFDVDHYSIGFGTRARSRSDGPITRSEALARLRSQVDSTYGHEVDRLNREHKLGLNQNQFDALTSFVFNVGPGGIAASTDVGAALRRGDFRAATEAMQDWNKSAGRPLAGLTRRRSLERALFHRRPPVAYSDEEREQLAKLKARPGRAPRARAWLQRQAFELQERARAEPDGWHKHDRGRRYQGIRRALKRYG